MYYTDIALTCPTAARPGESVNITVKIKNISDYPTFIDTYVIIWDKATGYWERPIMQYDQILAGETKEYNGNFIMFENDADVAVYTYVGEDVLDNEIHKTIKAGVAVSPWLWVGVAAVAVTVFGVMLLGITAPKSEVKA